MKAVTDIAADYELDVRGECCPYPLVRTKKQVDALEPGEILKVIADDPVAPQNIDQWSRKSGNKLLAVEQKDGEYLIFVEKA
ncbi:MAG: sulfurtransferase TusA family protein [Methanosarcinales archaeon]|nr:sulfurtransferase TusA family protein [ANME-2 cluster archaeon]MDW7776963.1 sulfurtransferase TusA family protein [Methanosarcinales archaeon]